MVNMDEKLAEIRNIALSIHAILQQVSKKQMHPEIALLWIAKDMKRMWVILDGSTPKT